MTDSWFSFLDDGVFYVLDFFRDLFFSVLPQSLVSILFLFPALLIVYGLVRFFYDIFHGGA